jgi:hypothetical protein
MSNRLINGRRLRVGLGALGLVLGALSLSPDDGDAGSGTPPHYCVGRTVYGTYSTANAWQAATVCGASEVAHSAGGDCPGSSIMRGLSTSGEGDLDRLVWLRCSASGSALWSATCCHDEW